MCHDVGIGSFERMVTREAMRVSCESSQNRKRCCIWAVLALKQENEESR